MAKSAGKSPQKNTNLSIEECAIIHLESRCSNSAGQFLPSERCEVRIFGWLPKEVSAVFYPGLAAETTSQGKPNNKSIFRDLVVSRGRLQSLTQKGRAPSHFDPLE